MHIAILEAGRTNPRMPAEFFHYPDMFETLFADQPNCLDFQFSIVPVIADVFPQTVDDYDGYLITGSAYGVYDEVPFIPKLMKFIQDIFDTGKPLVGICFGHQIVAHTLGGHAAKFKNGWGIGTMPIKMVGKADWIPADIRQVDLIHVHQDQVITLPPDAVRLAQSDFCQNAAFAIGTQVFAIQGHPEFTPAYTSALIDIREDKIGKELAATARNSLRKPHDGYKVGGWILNFFAAHDMADRPF